MKLTRIVFHAFKSLLNMELEVSQNCIGFVGINESGKSNVLTAIHILGGEKKLTEADTPKMEKGNPHITYTFELSDAEFGSIQTKCTDLFKRYIPEFTGEIITQKKINYDVEFRREAGIEYRNFSFTEIKINENWMILHSEKYVNGYQIRTKDGFKNIEDCKIISNESFELHLDLEQKIKKCQN